MPHAAVSWSPEQLSSAIVCVGGYVGECACVSMYVFTARVSNASDIVQSQGQNKEKGQRMKNSFIAISNFLKNSWNFHLLYL